MSIKRFFMDWNQPALSTAVDYFAQHYFDGDQNRLGMDRVLVVVPGSRAGRRLSQMLAAKAAELEAVLFPPRIQTVGYLPENLYDPKRPFADELTQQLAWIESIKGHQSRVKKFFPHLSQTRETVDWLDLAAMLAGVHRELAADGLDFSDAVATGKKLKGFGDTARWRFLRSLQEGYLEVLNGLGLWDLQTARLFAIKHAECHTQDDIFMLGTVDLNKSTREMLAQVSTRVVAMVHAPESEAAGFDEYGCLEPRYWQTRQIPIQKDQVLITDQPVDQANAVLHWMDSFPGETCADQIVVGVPAHEVATCIEGKFKDYGIKSHWAIGRSLADSSPAKLLQAICAVLEWNRYPDFAALIRHPDMEAWLKAKEDEQPSVSADCVISESDQYYTEHLVPQFGTWLDGQNGTTSLRWAIDAIQGLLDSLRQKSLPLSHWVAPLLGMLSEVYSRVQLDSDNEDHASTIQTLSQTRILLESFLDVPGSLNIKTDAVNVLRLLSQKLGQQAVSTPPALGAVELLGWLELPLDVADTVIVTSFNEGVIPESLNADMFLPNSLRKALQLTDNEQRFARDAYAVASMLYSKKDLRFVIGKRNLSGDPLTPSRIYFSTDREAIAERVREFSRPVDFVEPQQGVAAITESEFFVPYPDASAVQIDSISVTSFRTFLQCPYRFYLRHVLGLRAVHDQDLELNGMVFGNVLHELFREFGESDMRFCERETEIAEYLEHELEQLTQRWFGTRRLPAMEIQIQQMRYRLQGFAQWQSKRTREGWEIRHIEKGAVDSAGIDFEFEPGRSVKIKGKIDRIDFHESTHSWQILDYKTGDKGESPKRTHLRQGDWIDLQLPLYQYIANTFGVEGQVQLGYILVPKAIKETGESIAGWSQAEIDEAVSVGRQCARKIVDLEFWEPTYPVPLFAGQEFSSICQDDVFEPRFECPPEKEKRTASGGEA